MIGVASLEQQARVAPHVPARVFITGANGFIGRALAIRLRELGAQVTGVDLAADPEHGVIAGSTTDPAAWADALAGVDAVIHTAAIVSNVASVADAWQVNVLGTRLVLQEAAQHGVRRFVHLSSIAAYGFDYQGVIDETYPIRVNGDSYTDTKVNSEAVVMTAHAAGEIPCTIIRPGDVYGPGSVWVREPLQMIKARQLVLPAGGAGVFHPIYIDDLVDGILLALSNEAAAGQVFLLTAGHGIPCKEFFGRLAAMAGGSITMLPSAIAVPLAATAGKVLRGLRQPSELSAATMRMLSATGDFSIDKARSVLGFEPRVPFDEGMKRVQAWARAEGMI